MAKPVFQCEVCKSVYPSIDEADACEKFHPKKQDLVIQGIVFRRELEARFTVDRRIEMTVPKKIWIKFGPNFGQSAEYTLSHVGPRGM